MCVAWRGCDDALALALALAPKGGETLSQGAGRGEGETAARSYARIVHGGVATGWRQAGRRRRRWGGSESHLVGSGSSSSLVVVELLQGSVVIGQVGRLAHQLPHAGGAAEPLALRNRLGEWRDVAAQQQVVAHLRAL